MKAKTNKVMKVASKRGERIKRSIQTTAKSEPENTSLRDESPRTDISDDITSKRCDKL